LLITAGIKKMKSMEVLIVLGFNIKKYWASVGQAKNKNEMAKGLIRNFKNKIKTKQKIKVT